MSKPLHLMTQDNQPYMSTRKCCELCGVMIQNRGEAYAADRDTFQKALDGELEDESGDFVKCTDYVDWSLYY